MASKYEDILSLSKFQGFNQCTDGHNLGLGFAVSGKNFNTAYGGLKPYHKAVDVTSDGGIQLTEGGAGALTLAFLNKRWQMNAGVIGKSDSNTNAYCVAVVDGRLYYRQKAYGSFEDTQWTELLNPDTNASFAFENSKFDHVTYELNYLPPVQISADIITQIYGGSTYYIFDYDDYAFYEVHSDDGTTAYYTNREDTRIALTNVSKVRVSSEEAPIDCLLITNSDDGMYCIYAPLESNALKVVRVPVQPAGTTQDIKFGTLARYAERIWGAAIDTDPDKLMYSAPYDFFNWEQWNDQPDDGAGDIQQPNWDGDKFVALKEFGSSLLAIKQNAIWRITGTTPSDLVMRKLYGEGAIAEDSVAVNGSYAYMLTDDDVKIYNGSSTGHFKYGYIKDILTRNTLNLLNEGVNQQIVGRMFQDDYVLQIPHGEYGHLFLIYNTAEGTVNICESEGATALEVYDNKLYGLYPVETSTGTNVELGIFLTDSGTQQDVSWVSSWQDLGAKHVTKSGFILYFMFDGEDVSDENAEITFTATMESEKKSKSKEITMKYDKLKRVRLNCQGRQFRLRLDIPAQPHTWKISTGIQIYVEYDED